MYLLYSIMFVFGMKLIVEIFSIRSKHSFSSNPFTSVLGFIAFLLIIPLPLHLYFMIVKSGLLWQINPQIPSF